VAQNDFAGALTSRDDSLAISERLAQSHPGNVGLQRDVSISLTKKSDVPVALRDFAGALKSCQDSLNIAERLAQANSDNPGFSATSPRSTPNLAPSIVVPATTTMQCLRCRKARRSWTG
jgi:hypothetical protein